MGSAGSVGKLLATLVSGEPRLSSQESSPVFSICADDEKNKKGKAKREKQV
jgi:hypothetical protein